MGMVHLGFTFSNVTSVGVIVLPYIANFLKSLFDYTGKFLFYQVNVYYKANTKTTCTEVNSRSIFFISVPLYDEVMYL